MRWLKRIINKIVVWSGRDNENDIQTAPDPISYGLDSRGMRFNIYPATGGWVAEYRPIGTGSEKYIGDDSSSTKLHIISSNDDLGEQLSRIITYEVIRR